MHRYFLTACAENRTRYQAATQQFPMREMDGVLGGARQDIVEKLTRNGAFAFRGPPIAAEIEDRTGRPSCVVSFPPAARFHLGYSSVLKEAEIWATAGASVTVILSAAEASVRGAAEEDLQARIDYSRSFLTRYFAGSIAPTIIVDREWGPFLSLELQLQNHMKIAKLNQLLGRPEDGDTLARYRISSLMATTFVFAAQMGNAGVVVPLGMNEMAYTELAKIVARKASLKEPTFTFRGQINDTTNTARMSSKTPEKALHIDETWASTATKLRRTVTNPVTPKPEQPNDGRPEGCHFLRLLAALPVADQLFEGTYLECYNGLPCRDCKSKVASTLAGADTPDPCRAG